MGLASAPLALMGLMFLPVVSFAIGIAALALVFGLSLAVQALRVTLEQ